jgi:hypothetical protein
VNLSPRLRRFGLIGLAVLAAGAQPGGATLQPEMQVLDARYVVTGEVVAAPPSAAAHFRLLVTRATTADGPKAGQTIEVRFLGDEPVVPPAGLLVNVWLLGEKDGLYLVCPGTQCMPVMPTADSTRVGGNAAPDSRTAMTWVVVATVAAVAAYFVFSAVRSARRGPQRGGRPTN